MAKTYTANDLPSAVGEPPECQDLQSSLQQISFDVNQMINTFLGLSECAPSPSNTGFRAYLESCLLHVRNLLKFFSDGSIPGKGTAEDFAREGRSSNVIQALDFRLVRDVIDQYLVAENGLRTVDSSLPVDQILGAAVVALADAFESFIDVLSVGSREKMLLENGTRVALGKLKKLKDFKE